MNDKHTAESQDQSRRRSPRSRTFFKYWERYNARVANDAEVPDWQLRFIEETRKLGMPDGGRILEVGGANGRFLYAAGRILRTDELVGVDIIRPSIGIRFTMAIADGRLLPFSNESFDMVYSVGLLEHFEEAMLKEALKEQVRVLKKSGYLAISVPNLTLGALRGVKTFLLNPFRGNRHYEWKSSAIEEFLVRNGISILKRDYVGWALHIGSMRMPSPEFLANRRMLADDWILIGRKSGM